MSSIFPILITGGAPVIAAGAAGGSGVLIKAFYDKYIRPTPEFFEKAEILVEKLKEAENYENKYKTVKEFLPTGLRYLKPYLLNTIDKEFINFTDYPEVKEAYDQGDSDVYYTISKAIMEDIKDSESLNYNVISTLIKNKIDNIRILIKGIPQFKDFSEKDIEIITDSVALYFKPGDKKLSDCVQRFIDEVKDGQNKSSFNNLIKQLEKIESENVIMTYGSSYVYKDYTPIELDSERFLLLLRYEMPSNTPIPSKYNEIVEPKKPESSSETSKSEEKKTASGIFGKVYSYIPSMPSFLGGGRSPRSMTRQLEQLQSKYPGIY